MQQLVDDRRWWWSHGQLWWCIFWVYWRSSVWFIWLRNCKLSIFQNHLNTSSITINTMKCSARFRPCICKNASLHISFVRILIYNVSFAFPLWYDEYHGPFVLSESWSESTKFLFEFNKAVKHIDSYHCNAWCMCCLFCRHILSPIKLF